MPDPGNIDRARRSKDRLTPGSHQLLGGFRYPTCPFLHQQLGGILYATRPFLHQQLGGNRASELTRASGARDYRRMPIGITEEHEHLRRAVRRFVDDHIDPSVVREALEAATLG